MTQGVTAITPRPDHLVGRSCIPAASTPVRNSSTASSGETGLTGRPVPSSRPAISRSRGWISQCQAGRRVDRLLERRRVEHEVVWRPVEAGREAAEHLAQGLGGAREVGVGGAREVGVVAARNHPHLER